ncbi:hypothetical protein HYH02_012877 [Chlamydomonas schloesseri]|uniref:Uncharacterized protein n=1 Tax=Chlamydomonas schloesseri TaxID=2026947 RepID=A0A835STB4_9CHLO|nr:hypothetical protein HYH02_012877 [Chlamydomonas schloesseri]|eukprot:KAG2432743.1 hypothetical protein HYH02_012877 [Chlamydomonas schloesseri]
MASTGGCDSSDCLFCQYRSNSPFHLNAYAGKLTSLLRKRSANGAALASLNTLLETSNTEQGAALLAAVGGAAVAAACGASNAAKRHRTGSHSGSASGPLPNVGGLATASATATAAAGPVKCSGPLGRTATADVSSAVTGLVAARAGPPQPSSASASALMKLLPVGDAEHDCRTMCEGGCEGHAGRTAVQVHATSATGVAHESARTVHGVGLTPLPNGSAAGTGQRHEALVASNGHVASAHGGVSTFERLSSLSLEHHMPDHHLQPSRGQPPLAPASSSGGGSETGSQFPEGWAFRSEWRGRQDPAPAALQEVLRLSAGGGCSTSSLGSGYGGGGGARRPSHRVTSGSGGSTGAGIVCALEFSPDGRLLAAGGVDKQIRLYNLSSFFGELEEGEEDELGVVLTSAAAAAGGGGGIGRQGSRGSLPVSRRNSRDNDEDDDEDDDDRRIRRAKQAAAAARGQGAGLDAGDGGGAEEGEGLLAVVQRMPSKVSCISWSPFMDGVMTVGDYDGVLLQLHIASGHQLSDVDAHGGRKIWSVAHSHRSPHLAASAADDRTARLWAGRGLAACVATLQPNPRASVCCVDFSPEHDHLLALACSDRVSYLYDMRRLAGGPLAALRHHARPASYCRFLGSERLVTAATDASLALWDLAHAVPQLVAEMSSPAAAAAMAGAGGGRPDSPFRAFQQAAESSSGAPGVCAGSGAGAGVGLRSCSEPARVFRGHRNEKNFVGLSVRWPDGLVACGSECSRAFAYHTSWSDPLATLDLARSGGGGGGGGAGGGACSALSLQLPVVSNWSSGLPSGSGGAGLPSGSGGMGGVGGSGFVSAVCWQPAEAAEVLGLPPLLASASSCGAVSLSVLAARGG